MATRRRRKSGSHSKKRRRSGGIFARLSRDLNKLRDSFRGASSTGRSKHRRKKPARRRRARRSRDWKGNAKGHATASRKGWKRVAKAGWHPKKRTTKRRSAKSRRRR